MSEGASTPGFVCAHHHLYSALARGMPPEVVAKTKLHTLDTIAAMVSGARLKAGEFPRTDG